MNGLQILLVDDRSWKREILRGHILRKWPRARISELDSITIARRGGIGDVSHNDVVMLSQQLDYSDSLDILRTIRAMRSNAAVVVMADSTDEAGITAAFASGAADILAYSRLEEGSVQAVIREVLRSRRPTRPAPPGLRPAPISGVALPGYAIEAHIASSAMSSVYRARSLASGEAVAIKLLRGLAASGGEALERFLQEHAVLSSLSDDHVVRIYDIGNAGDDVFVAMEYLAGGTLRDLLSRGPLNESRAVELTRQICLALEAIHSADILHRDLKPANVLLNARGGACLIDFGLAKRLFVELELTAPGRIYGTPYYMSPEQGQGLAAGPASDLYSLGIVFYELLTAIKPYVASTPVALVFKHAHAPLPRLPVRLAHWQGLVDQLLAKRPGDRPASASIVIELLNHCKSA